MIEYTRELGSDLLVIWKNVRNRDYCIRFPKEIIRSFDSTGQPNSIQVVFIDGYTLNASQAIQLFNPAGRQCAPRLVTTDDREEYLHQIHEYLRDFFASWLGTLITMTPRTDLDSRRTLESVKRFLGLYGIQMPLGCIRTILIDNQFHLRFMDMQPELEREFIQYGLDFSYICQLG